VSWVIDPLVAKCDAHYGGRVLWLGLSLRYFDARTKRPAMVISLYAEVCLIQKMAEG
jgi:hypothetical protein